MSHPLDRPPEDAKPINDAPENVPDNARGDEDRMPDHVLKARADACPLRDCKGDEDDGYYIRDVRNNRHLCRHCAVPSPTGYIGRDTAKEMDDRYFQGTQQDYAISFLIMMGGSAVANVLTLFIASFIGFFGIIIGFFVGNFAGTYVAREARQRTGRRVGRHSAQIGVAGVVAGMFLAPTLYILLRFGAFAFSLQFAFQLPLIVCTGVMAYVAWGIFKRRI